MKNTFKKAWFSTLNGIKQNITIILSILLIVSIVQNINIEKFLGLFDNSFVSVVLGDIIGSIFAGNPINSYLLAGSFGNIHQNMIVISVFLISWVTVGIVQLPAEFYFFGKKFAIIRNLLSFIFAIICSYLIYFIIIYLG